MPHTTRRTRVIASGVLTAALAAGLTVVEPIVVGTPEAAAVSKSCKKNSRVFVNRMTRDIPNIYGGGDRTTAKGGSAPDYRVTSRTWYCGRSDHLHAWKGRLSYRFPDGTNPCNLGFQGAQAVITYGKPDETRKITLNCDSDGRARKTIKFSIDIHKKIACPQPELCKTAVIRLANEGMWNAIKNHHDVDTVVVAY